MSQELFEENAKTKRMHNEPLLNLDIALVLKEIVVQRRNRYGTSIAEDNALLRNNQVQGRFRMAIEVRLGEKEILADALAFIQQRIDGLGQEALLVTSTQRSREDTITSKRRKIQIGTSS